PWDESHFDLRNWYRTTDRYPAGFANVLNGDESVYTRLCVAFQLKVRLTMRVQLHLKRFFDNSVIGAENIQRDVVQFGDRHDSGFRQHQMIALIRRVRQQEL